MCQCGAKACGLIAHNHICPVCGEPHYTRWGAASCCDPITNDLDTDG